MSEGGWGEGKKKARRGRWEGKREEARPQLPPFPPSHRSPRAFFLLLLLQFLLLGYPAGASAEEGSNLKYSATISPIFSH